MIIMINLVLLWTTVAVMMVLVLLLYRQFGLMYLGSGAKARLPGIDVGSPVPELLAGEINGRYQEWTLSSGPLGKPSVLVFGSADCRFCENVMRGFPDFDRAFDSQFDLYFIDRDAQGVEPSFRQIPKLEKLRYVLSRGGTIHELFDVTSTPHAYIVDQQGVVRARAIVNDIGGVVVMAESLGYQPSWTPYDDLAAADR